MNIFAINRFDKYTPWIWMNISTDWVNSNNLKNSYKNQYFFTALKWICFTALKTVEHQTEFFIRDKSFWNIVAERFHSIFRATRMHFTLDRFPIFWNAFLGFFIVNNSSNSSRNKRQCEAYFSLVYISSAFKVNTIDQLK